MIKAHKIRLNPTPEQEDYLRRAAGTRRFVYNWGLAEWNKQYAEYPEGQRDKKRNARALKKHFQAIRETHYPWTLDVTKCVIEGAFVDLEDAWTRYFTGQNERPKFKKKHKCRESFSLANDKFTVGQHWIVVPVLGRFLIGKQEANGILPQKIRNRCVSRSEQQQKYEHTIQPTHRTGEQQAEERPYPEGTACNRYRPG
jgi:putative transposase